MGIEKNSYKKKKNPLIPVETTIKRVDTCCTSPDLR